jgi:general L-amino acid transport system permease protein
MKHAVMSAQTFLPIAARPAPVVPSGPGAWLRSHLFHDWKTSFGTLLVSALLFAFLPPLLRWSVLSAVWEADYTACSAGSGACWGVVREKFRFILFGRYPFDEHWRALLASGLLLTLVVVSCVRIFWKRWLPVLWIATLTVYFLLMRGGVAALVPVDTDLWSGLPLTLLLATGSMVMAFPMAIFIALGRRSAMPAICSLCAVYVELVRGVPLISVLFMASFMVPLLLPQGFNTDVLLRVLAGITLFSAAYLSEVIRGGLQAIPKGQTEAAATLGLSYWQTQRRVILPQALAVVVPSIMNNFISAFKDTSLVAIVSLYELTGAMGMAMNSDANWRPFRLEGYLFIALIYFVFCFSMSRYSLWVEKTLKPTP